MLSSASFLPSRAWEPYFVISTEWFAQWKAYTCLESDQDPGPINSPPQLKTLVMSSSIFPFQTDYLFNSLHLKDSSKEDQHYKIVGADVWNYLYQRYGGKAIPRYSV